MPIRADILSQLADVLAELYYNQGSIQAMVITAGLKWQQIPVYPRANDTWVFVLEEAEVQGRTQAILDRARSEKPVYEPLRQACQAYADWVTAGSTELAEVGRPRQAPAYGTAVKPYRLNIPTPPSHFVGRADLVQLLAGRLCTSPNPKLALHGQPGVGKSTLAAILATHPQVQAHFTDGVLWAGLGPQADVMSTLAAWGQALGFDVTDQPTPELRAQAVGRAIGTQRLLLVLDDAWEIEPVYLLRVGGAGCGHLLTTRNLSLARKFTSREYAISIPVLDDDPAFLLLQTLAPEACVAGEAVARQLAQSLGGLPLALELVGGFLAEPEHSLFPELGMAALGEMSDPAQRLQLAAVRLGTLDGRQVSLQETITLSVEQLPPLAAAAFYVLGTFAARPATFDLAAAKAVTQADAAALATLVARSLVEQDGPELLALHQTIADVARTRLPAEAVQRHRDYYLDLVDEDREDWQRIQALYPQVTHAWAQLGSATERVFDFVGNLGTFHERQGLWQDKLTWANRGLEIARSENLDANAASLLVHLGYVYDALGEKQQALAYYEQALPLRRQVGDRSGEATTLNNMGSVYDALGEKQQALAYFEQALPLFRQVGDRSGEATTLAWLGHLSAGNKNFTAALDYYAKSLDLLRQIGDRWTERLCRRNIANIHRAIGNVAAVEEQLCQVVTLDVVLNHPDLKSDQAALEVIQTARRAQAPGS